MNFLRQARWWRRFILGTFWVPIGAEIYLRLFAPVPMLPRYIEAGKYGVRANMPERTYRHQTPEYEVELRTNAAGMRADEDFPWQKPRNTKRILVLGDSFAMGYGVNFEDTSLYQLEMDLETALQCDVDVINLSVSGFGPAEELITLEKTGLRYSPDLVIQYFTSNDPVDDSRSSLYAIKDGQLQRDRDTYLPAVRIREYLFSFTAYRWLAGESHLYNLFRDLAGSKAKQILAMIRSFRVTPEPGSSSTPEEDLASTRDELTLSILSRIQDMSLDAGANFLILSIPVRQSRTEFVDRFPGSSPDLPVVSPISRFNEAGGEMLYWERSHGHWTPLGCRLVADTLLEAITSEDLLGESCETSSRD